jgi:hypothetical protein
VPWRAHEVGTSLRPRRTHPDRRRRLSRRRPLRYRLETSPSKHHGLRKQAGFRSAMGGTGLEPVTPSLSSLPRLSTQPDVVGQKRQVAALHANSVDCILRVSTSGADIVLTRRTWLTSTSVRRTRLEVLKSVLRNGRPLAPSGLGRDTRRQGRGDLYFGLRRWDTFRRCPEGQPFWSRWGRH